MFEQLAEEEGLQHEKLHEYFQKCGINISEENIHGTFQTLFKGTVTLFVSLEMTNEEKKNVNYRYNFNSTCAIQKYFFLQY